MRRTTKPMHADDKSPTSPSDANGVACGDLVLRVGEWYVRPSNVGIPRHVKLMTLTACGRYCVVSYTGKSNAPKHHCMASELKPGKYKSQENEQIQTTKPAPDGSK